MNNLQTYEQFINEDWVYDKSSNEPLFDSAEWYPAVVFFKIARKSEELKSHIRSKKPSLNIGKGIWVLEQLMKRTKHKFKVRIYRSEWNYGGNLVMTIRLAYSNAPVYSGGQFEFNSGNSTTTPSYAFGDLFDGVRTREGDKNQEANVWYGGYRSISNIDLVVEDILHLLGPGYEAKYGKPFDPKSAMKEMKTRNRIEADWRKIRDKVLDLYSEAKTAARKVSYDIDMRQPRFNIRKMRVEFKHEEPRWMRHPDEYSGDKLESKEYYAYEKAISKMTDMIDKFVKKHKIEFLHAGSWSD